MTATAPRRYVTIPMPDVPHPVDLAEMLTTAAAHLRAEEQLAVGAMSAAVAQILDSTAAALAVPPEGGTTVTATDGRSSETHSIVDDYVITTDGSAHVDNVQIHRRSDGTSTHVITVRGCRQVLEQVAEVTL
jgi:hypothetical protein